MNFLLKILSMLQLNNKSTKPIGHVAICVGHSRIGDFGAESVEGVTEWDYNVIVAEALREALDAKRIAATIVNEYPRKSYSEAMDWLSRHIRSLKCDCAVELHFNAAAPMANGFEYLHLDGSLRGAALAKAICDAHERKMSDKQKNRGVKNIVRGERGYEFLRLVLPPAVICEPFFGTNQKEWALFDRQWDELADIYAEGIEHFLKN